MKKVFMAWLLLPVIAWADGTPAKLYVKSPSENPDDSRIRQNIQQNGPMKAALEYIIKKRGRIPTLTSGYRDQNKENGLASNLRKRGVRGRLTVSKHSQHTYGIAADLDMGLTGSSACKFMAEVRQAALGGKGGIGFEQGAAHLDLRSEAVSVGACKNKKYASDERDSPIEDAYLQENGGSQYL